MVGQNIKVGLNTTPTSWVVGVLHSVDVSEHSSYAVARVDGLEKIEVQGQQRDLATRTSFSLDDVIVWRSEEILPLT